MIIACQKCQQLFEGDFESATRVCERCVAIDGLLDCADSFVLWKLKVDVTSGTEAANQLYALIDRIEAAAAKARAL